MKVLLVDDHVLFRDGLASLLKSQPSIEVVGEVGSAREAIEVAHNRTPDVILMDLGLPDESGLVAMEAILANRPKTKVVFLTVHEEDDLLFSALRSGAAGYLLKNVSWTRLLEFLQGVVEGKAAITREMASRVLIEFSRDRSADEESEPPHNKLTTRELDVLKEMATGATNWEIGDNLAITESTVKKHVSSILAKLDLENRREAARYAREHQIIDTSFGGPSAQ